MCGVPLLLWSIPRKPQCPSCLQCWFVRNASWGSMNQRAGLSGESRWHKYTGNIIVCLYWKSKLACDVEWRPFTWDVGPTRGPLQWAPGCHTQHCSPGLGSLGNTLILQCLYVFMTFALKLVVVSYMSVVLMKPDSNFKMIQLPYIFKSISFGAEEMAQPVKCP